MSISVAYKWVSYKWP